MLTDRSYVHFGYLRKTTSALTWTLCALAATFIMQAVSECWLGSSWLESYLALHPINLRLGHLWTLVTCTFLHASLLHLIVNSFGLFLTGRELMPLMNPIRFFGLYAGAAIFGGLFWCVSHWEDPHLSLVGISSVVAAMFVVFACIYPEREVTFFVFFVFPVTLRPRVLVWLFLAFEGLNYFLGELAGGCFDIDIAHSAHLGGMAAGLAYYWFCSRGRWLGSHLRIPPPTPETESLSSEKRFTSRGPSLGQSSFLLQVRQARR